MAYSIQREVSDGTLALIDVSIEYLDRTEITVLYNGVLYTTGWTWVGDADKKVIFDPVVPLGVEISIVRSTELGELRHRFSAGAAFTAQSMDEALEQVLHIAQEARENLTLTDLYIDLNMHGYKLTNVGAGTGPSDAVNYAQLTSRDSTIQGYATAAAGSASSAADSASAANSSAAAAAASAAEAASTVTVVGAEIVSATAANATAAANSAYSASTYASLSAGSAGSASVYSSLAQANATACVTTLNNFLALDYLSDFGLITETAGSTTDYGLII